MKKTRIKRTQWVAVLYELSTFNYLMRKMDKRMWSCLISWERILYDTTMKSL